MAIPRVFISSTCYDLSEVRDTLVTFINSFGFEDALSERGDVFYHPDLHTHDSCIREISNCHLLILIIGGRFGGTYKAEIGKSIVNAEYEAARKLNIPVFTFVKKDVLSDHKLFERNKDKDGICYPSIDKQVYSKHIFEFINSVRKSPTNNGFFDFQFSRDIEDILKKQWAGLFYEFLADRANKSKLQSANQTLSQLNTMSRKIEELVENIYRKVDKAQADVVIESIDRKADALSFFRSIRDWTDKPILLDIDIDKVMKIPTNQDWFEWLAKLPDFKILDNVVSSEGFSSVLLHKKTLIRPVKEGVPDLMKKENEELRMKFESFKMLDKNERRKILESIADPF